MLPPIPRCSGWVYHSRIPPGRISLPRYGSRVGLHIVLFEACSAFTRVAACTLALSPIRDTLIEGFSHFVTSMTAPIASGWSGLPGGACTHWKAPPLHGARHLQTLPPTAITLMPGQQSGLLWARIEWQHDLSGGLKSSKRQWEGAASCLVRRSGLMPGAVSARQRSEGRWPAAICPRQNLALPCLRSASNPANL